MQKNFSFYKNDAQEWFVDLPKWQGEKEDLQMVEGADKLLDLLSANGNECTLLMSDERQDDSELLTLIHKREPNLGGGGDYLLEKYNEEALHLKLWLCGVTEFVFKSLPQKIWFKKV